MVSASPTAISHHQVAAADADTCNCKFMPYQGTLLNLRVVYAAAVEKEAQEKLKKQQEKAQRKKERQLAATGVVKTKRKGLRIRKGVRVKVR